ncbi:MAG: N-acetyltransferase, partial [Gammaproteobacteria bacterium]|nr:N-acetyltransferase [Gammaproteobacteria bacterium]
MIDFLDKYADKNFKVLVLNNQVIGCGGHYTKHTEKVFGIAWVMFKRYSIGRDNFMPVATYFFNYLLTNIENENLDYDIVI